MKTIVKRTYGTNCSECCFNKLLLNLGSGEYENTCDKDLKRKHVNISCIDMDDHFNVILYIFKMRDFSNLRIL